MKTFLAFIFAILMSALPGASARAQETEAASESNLTGVALPANAQRVSPASVPAEISGTLSKMVASGGGKLQQGNSEVLAWMGAGYKKANSVNIVNKLRGSLQSGGWAYEVGGEESGVTVFSALKDGANRRAIIGFYAATDDALLLAWTELLSSQDERNATQNIKSQAAAQPANADADDAAVSGNARELIGTWDNGYSSILAQRQNTITGAVTPGRSSYFSYKFNPNGTFQFIGTMQTTNYSCTTTLFNDKAGRYRISGSTITLIPTKNYWKNSNCTPSNTTEKNHTLTEETYQWRMKTDEYGKRHVCLSSNNQGESCYRFKAD
jgi:hypothetical protein